jgi:Uma2 family endonuclease
VICSEYEAEEPVIADPVLIVEILSASNEAETWANVWAYTTIPSVREIVVLQTVSIGAELLRRCPDGSWPRTPEAIESGDLVLESLGFQTSLTAVYRTTRLARRSGAAGG